MSMTVALWLGLSLLAPSGSASAPGAPDQAVAMTEPSAIGAAGWSI